MSTPTDPMRRALEMLVRAGGKMPYLAFRKSIGGITDNALYNRRWTREITGPPGGVNRTDIEITSEGYEALEEREC